MIGLTNDFNKQFKNVIDILDPCMDDFLYILDFENDSYQISESAVERFAMSNHCFTNTKAGFEEFVYPADYDAVIEDVGLVKKGEKTFHNMQYRWIDKEGKTIWINCRGRVVVDDNGKPMYLVGCINEIGKKQKADNVSGLLGDVGLQNDLAGDYKDHKSGYFLRVGIDNFKEVNENKGISYGDMVLQKTAEAISEILSPTQKLYKIVADEFMITDFSCKDKEECQRFYKRIQARIIKFVRENKYEVIYTVSAGILYLDEIEDNSYDNLMKLSEFALNEAKARGKNKFYVFDAKDYEAFLRKKKLIRIMRQSVNNNYAGFETYFQPIMDIKKGGLTTAETLLRFNCEETGPISPVEFIPLLEESGLIIPVGRWVLHQAMALCKKMQDIIPGFRVSVNLSYVQVMKSNVLRDIVDGIKEYGLPKGSMLVELTESGFLEMNTNFISFCEGLKENDIPLALDDFGTGYSNFHYLYDLKPDTIKIDRSFTLKALRHDYEYNLLRYMADLAHGTDLYFCIEGIETKEELEKICKIDPDYIQGFYFGKPSPVDQFMKNYISE